MYHCGHGDGPVISNLLPSLMAWVERGVAPNALTGVHVPGDQGGFGPPPSTPPAAPALTRPINPYPYTAKYIGSGDMRDARKYVRGPALPAPAALTDWPGAKFYRKGYMRWCTATDTSLNCEPAAVR